MKKIISLMLITVLTLSCVIGLTACSSAEDRLIGTWEYKKHCFAVCTMFFNVILWRCMRNDADKVCNR
jgi:hypothetical protein